MAKALTSTWTIIERNNKYYNKTLNIQQNDGTGLQTALERTLYDDCKRAIEEI